MTLIITTIFKGNLIIATDRKQSPPFDQIDKINLMVSHNDEFAEIYNREFPDIKKIVRHEDFVVTGTGNSLILDKLKNHFVTLYKNDKNEILEFEKNLKFINNSSDFNGLNIYTVLKLKNKAIFLTFYGQHQDNTYKLYNYLTAHFNEDSGDYDLINEILISPMVDIDSKLEKNIKDHYLNTVITNNVTYTDVVEFLKGVFKIYNAQSKIVSRSFDLVYIDLENGQINEFFIENK